ncbi:MAG: hypothetical protein ONB46_23645 [candidate division KSB1 bacterium]|nr:hypothetical protein [candidate division KSB1 bacterium]MDZ7368861.1 hypothetical protein [candidate division KSB1 bacterium]MDZ7407160.1 hypothetical protein [candidate division KSB1 bacterium]
MLKRKRRKPRTTAEERALNYSTLFAEMLIAHLRCQTVHGLIEDEFYCVERFHSRSHFLARAGAYNLWFNVARQNSSKGHKTPWEIIHPAVAAWQPVFLDEIWRSKFDTELKGGTMLFRNPFFR